MILLCGIPSEAPLRMAIEAADRLNVPYVLFNQREAHFIEMYLEVKGGHVDGILRIREQDWPLESFTGVYARLMDYQELPENKPRGRFPADTGKEYKSLFLHTLFSEWLEMTDCRVMNRNSFMNSNASKPYQAQIILQAGFKVPVTLITNDPAKVRKFLQDHRPIIYKSVSSTRSVVKVLGDIKMNELNKVRHLPTQFQEFIPGVNVRVHVAGEAVFATEIHTQAVDYRYAVQEGQNITMSPMDLPEEVTDKCLHLSSILNLPLCGIDLKRTPDDDYYCFEVNPSPAYSYYQENTGQDIAAAIVNYLQRTS